MNGKNAVDGLLGLASDLAKRLGRTEAAIVLVLIVVGLIAIPLALVKSAFPYFLVLAVVAVLVIAVLLLLNRLDRSVPDKGLDERDRASVRAILLSARDDVAEFLKTEPTLCRANVIAENRLTRLQINRDLTVNMEGAPDGTVSMRPGQGCAGVAWLSREPHVAVYPFEGLDGLEPDQTRLVDPDVRWIISVPICLDDETPKWVVNFDGEEERAREELEAAVPALHSRLIPTMEAFAAKA